MAHPSAAQKARWSARAEAWTRAQDPALIAAIRRVFCKHGGYHGHTCATEADRELLSAWVHRSVMEGLTEGGRLPMFLVKPEVIVLPEARRGYIAGDPDVPCWFPGCTKGDHHGGQHSGIREAGKRLAELEAAIDRGELVWKVA